MGNVARGADIFGDGVGNGEDEVAVGVEVEGADGGGKEGEIGTVGAAMDAGAFLEEGDAFDTGIDFGVGGAGGVEEGGDAGAGEDAEELEEDFFAAAEGGEPVVDEPYAEGVEVEARGGRRGKMWGVGEYGGHGAAAIWGHPGW